MMSAKLSDDEIARCGLALLKAGRGELHVMHYVERMKRVRFLGEPGQSRRALAKTLMRTLRLSRRFAAEIEARRKAAE